MTDRDYLFGKRPLNTIKEMDYDFGVQGKFSSISLVNKNYSRLKAAYLSKDFLDLVVRVQQILLYCEEVSKQYNHLFCEPRNCSYR